MTSAYDEGSMREGHIWPNCQYAQQMALQVMNTDHRYSQIGSKSFGSRETDAKRGDETGAIGHPDRPEVIQRNVGHGKGLLDHGQNRFYVGPCCRFRNNTAPLGMKVDLAGDDVRAYFMPNDDSGACLVAAGFQRQDRMRKERFDVLIKPNG